MPLKDENLPFVQRESQFRRFERYIAEAIRIYPKPLSCIPINGMTTATFVARLRDAKASYEKYKWPSTTINRKRYDMLKEFLVAAQLNDTTILFGDRTSIETIKKAKHVPEIPVVIDANEAARTIHIADLPLKNFFVMLSHKRLLQPRVRVVGFTLQEVELYQEQFDVSFDQNHDGSFILI